MAVFKCKMCGGELHIDGTDKVVACEYCGTSQTVPSADSEKKLTLFNRANRLRMNNEFDTAAALYEQLVAEFPEEAEAYWGLCLCNYGIEYVDDPATGQKKPTCHRASFQKLTEDENYKLAMEYADVVARRVYRDEAREIDRINEDILALSRNEAPYDVFICYKETDDAGNRTPESVLSQDIYDALTAKGYKVFFSRVTLEDKLGMQYEPYIFAALNSAKVMLCVGTRYEYFHAVWVRNEWGRFLRLAAKDKRKVLIPCYKDMNPYDLPDEFKGLQAQDLGKLGAIQDLTRGVEKIVRAQNPPPAQKETVIVNAAAAVNAAPLVERALLFLEDGKWAEADAYCEKALDNDPKNAKAYLGKLMAELRVRRQEDLAQCEKPFDSSDNCQKALRFGDEALTGALQGYLTQINERIETARRDAVYTQAEEQVKTRSFAKAAELFRGIAGHRDADARAKECEAACRDLIYNNAEQKLKDAASEQDFAEAAEVFRSISGYKDADARAVECETARKDLIYAQAEQKLKNAKAESDFTAAKELFCGIIGYRDADARAEGCETARKDFIYSQAEHKLKNTASEQDFADAAELFRSISGYKDADALAEECEIARKDFIYSQAEHQLRNAKVEADFTTAAEIFRSIAGYKDADARAEGCETARKDRIYKQLENKLLFATSAESCAAAAKGFHKITGYKDADARALEAEAKAETLRAQTEKAAKRTRLAIIAIAAAVVLLIAGLILNAKVIQPNKKYNAAAALMAEGKYGEANSAFKSLNGYKDSAAKITDAQYLAAVKLMETGKYSEAISAFKSLNGYKDSAAQIEKAKTLVLKNANVGDIVTFGSYEQDNNTSNGKETIEWQVLAKEGSRLLVVSKYALDCQPYNTSYADVTWETCSLRAWLNGSFLNAAFSAEEQKMIPTVTVTADKTPKYGTDPGKDTNDKVFLLSITEANKYFSSDKERICGVTDYAETQGAWAISGAYSAGGKAACPWWLRSPGSDSYSAARVYGGGSVNDRGDGVNCSDNAVRPALWIDVG